MLKRSFDFLAALLALIVLSPVLLALAWAVRVKLGTPVLFAQPRPGRGGRIFVLYKFRSMTTARNKEGQLKSDAERLTPFGLWLRSSSLDELPELWNVVKGEMSLVGPRPLLVDYLSRYTPEEARRHEVRPGLTGLAQVLGRNGMSWRARLRLDVWYVENRSFGLDLKILARTVLKVFRQEGINSPGAATMPEFRPEQRTGETLPLGR